VAGFDLARRLRAGETVYAAWCSFAAPMVAETVARGGFAAVVLDMQHGLWDTGSIIAGIGTVDHAGASPVVRVPLNDFAFVSRALDFGAAAIIAPMINSAADARKFAAVAKFPPLGERSGGPQRAMTLQGKTATVDYLREANDGTLTMAMIETPMALAQVDSIAETPGIDALFIGPYDLSTSLSAGKAQDVQAAEVERAIDQICVAANKAGKIAGIYCTNAERALAMAKRGFRFVTVGGDVGYLRDGLAAQMKTLKG
jgi:4-hydroxy-2-oxoheptanedioate aldolase